MRTLVPVVLAVPLSACATLGYYAHLLNGQRELLASRVPIAHLLAEPARDPELKRRLTLVQQAHRFAVHELKLPANDSYTTYAELGRPYAVWNLFAAPEFSLEPRTWCHLVVGCLAYRGYYAEARAQDEAARLRGEAYDVYVAGVPAYSTLGWFDDPITSSMLRGDDDVLVGTLMHEMAHQRVFVSGDTGFNESFASFVEEEGLRRFRRSRGEVLRDPEAGRRQDQFAALVLAARGRLEAVYASARPSESKRLAKRAEMERLRSDHARLRAQWGGYPGYDEWFAGEINNAKLVPIGLYREWLPSFAALFARVQGDWAAFYAAVRELGEREAVARVAALEKLRADAGA